MSLTDFLPKDISLTIAMALIAGLPVLDGILR